MRPLACGPLTSASSASPGREGRAARLLTRRRLVPNASWPAFIDDVDAILAPKADGRANDERAMDQQEHPDDQDLEDMAAAARAGRGLARARGPAHPGPRRPMALRPQLA
jgi:hypothetical protein